MKRTKLNKEELITLLEIHKSVGNVSSFVGLPYSTIYSWYKSYDIELLPSCMTIYQELRDVELSTIHRSVILGSILGDGSLLKNKRSKNARLQIGHYTKQLGYLKWKRELLHPFVKDDIVQAAKPGSKTECGVESFSTGYYLFNTISHPQITEYRNKYYYKGYKRVHPSVVDELDLLGLAIWLADDGSFSIHNVNGIKGSIVTDSFTDEEIEILVCALNKFYVGNTCVSKNIIYMNGWRAIKELLTMITEILPSCIHYKFAPQRLNVRPHY